MLSPDYYFGMSGLRFTSFQQKLPNGLPNLHGLHIAQVLISCQLFQIMQTIETLPLRHAIYSYSTTWRTYLRPAEECMHTSYLLAYSIVPKSSSSASFVRFGFSQLNNTRRAALLKSSIRRHQLHTSSNRER
jgi:hypothetical protein